MTAAMLSVVIGEKCGYVRGPLASTNDTIVINLDCNHSAPASSPNYVPLQLHNNATHVAVQLVHCPTVPVGLFTNVTEKLASVTVASEDAVELLEGTFAGLGQVTELRLLGFTEVNIVSRSLLEPLRNLHTLVLDGFGSANIMLPEIGTVIRTLAGTPIRRLVLNNIKHRLFYQQIMQVDDFKISNASVKELIITDAPFSYEGSIRQAFPELVCFCGGGTTAQTAVTIPAIWDLLLLSDHLEEFVLHRETDLLSLYADTQPYKPIPITQFVPSVLEGANLYPDLLQYFLNKSASKRDDCLFSFRFTLSPNLSKLTVNGFSILIKIQKPICVEENNNIIHLDMSDSHMLSSAPPLYTGFNKLKYFSLENTGVKIFPTTFLQYWPSLKVLKLSKNDIGNFIENIDKNFFGSCPTLADIYLVDCKIRKIPSAIFSRSVNIEHIDMSQNYLRNVDLDLQNCTKLNVLNYSHNSIEIITNKSITQLSQVAWQKTGGNIVVDLRYNKLHCLCNSTQFIDWLQRSPSGSNIKFPDFDTYTCLYPNGSIVPVSAVSVGKLEQQCRVIQTLVNGSGCPCEEDLRRRIQQVWVYLDRFFCKNDNGDLVSMKSHPLPPCFNPYLRASFIAPVVVGGLLGITVLVTVGLLIYYRNSRRVKQVRECLEMNPFHFVHTALQYVMMHNHAEEQAVFQYDMIIFVQDDDRSCIHGHFTQALHRKRKIVTRDDFLPGVAEVDAMVESIRVCQWIVPVLTSNFLSDPVCVDFISRVQFSRPHALIPVVWEQSLDVTDVAVAELLRIGQPLHWPGDLATPEDIRDFWSSLLERTVPL